MSTEEGKTEVLESTEVITAPKTRGGTAKRGRPKKGSTVVIVTEKEANSTDETENGSESLTAVNGDTESSEQKSDSEVNESDEAVPNPNDANTAMNDISTEAPKNKENAEEVPELDDAPPPTITAPTVTSKPLKLRTSLSTSEADPQIPEGFTVVEEVESDSDDVQEVSVEKMEVDQPGMVTAAPQTQILDEMTVIDEVIDDTEKRDTSDSNKQSLEPDTEMVSEDELPTEGSKEQLGTEAVSDEELPTSGDLPDTEAVSEDELPPEGAEKKKRKSKTSAKKISDAKAQTVDGSGTKKETSKRKLEDGDYDPSSPTSVKSDDSRSTKKAAIEGKSSVKPVLPELEKYWKAVKDDATDFTGWTYLLQYVDQENDIPAAREAYDAFLSHYPYCYGYWRKFADYEKRKGNKEKCEEVFERGLRAIPFSVDLWIHYLNYCKATFADNEEQLRNTFEKALDACGLEFRSDRLWEAYLKWENEKKNLLNVTKIYDRLLATPTQGYQNHFDHFSEHVNNNAPRAMVDVDEFLTLRQEVLQLLKQNETPSSEPMAAPGDDLEAPPGEEPADENAAVMASPEETSKLRERIIEERKKIFSVTKEAVLARQTFEEGIKRPYFHVKPLERCQLKNWKDYLEFEMKEGDPKRINVLFERCLIACALYEDFWLRYLRYLEEKEPDKVDKIRDVYQRTCTIHHKKKPTLHLHWAVYEESQGNFQEAEEILCNLEQVVPNLLQVMYRRINLARRSGNLEEAAHMYEENIEKAANRIISNNLSIKYARFCWKILNNIDRAVEVLKKALEKDKDNPRLYLQLIDMAMQRDPIDQAEVVAVIEQYMSRESAELDQKILFAQRKIEFLEDFGSSVKSVQKASDEFHKLMKQFQDRKKKADDNKSKSDEPGSKKLKDSKDSSGSSHLNSQMSQPPPSSTGSYSTSSYNQGNYSQPPPSNYQGNYNQPPPYNQYSQPYNQNDPNYNNYQGWGYSQTGYGGYNQSWGSYNYY